MRTIFLELVLFSRGRVHFCSLPLQFLLITVSTFLFAVHLVIEYYFDNSAIFLCSNDGQKDMPLEALLDPTW